MIKAVTFSEITCSIQSDLGEPELVCFFSADEGLSPRKTCPMSFCHEGRRLGSQLHRETQHLVVSSLRLHSVWNNPPKGPEWAQKLSPLS